MCVDGAVRDKHKRLFGDGGRRKSDARRFSELEGVRIILAPSILEIVNNIRSAITTAHPCIGVEDGRLRKPAGSVSNNGEGGSAGNQPGEREKDVLHPPALPCGFVFPWRCVNEVFGPMVPRNITV